MRIPIPLTISSPRAVFRSCSCPSKRRLDASSRKSPVIIQPNIPSSSSRGGGESLGAGKVGPGVVRWQYMKRDAAVSRRPITGAPTTPNDPNRAVRPGSPSHTLRALILLVCRRQSTRDSSHMGPELLSIHELMSPAKVSYFPQKIFRLTRAVP